MDDKLQNNDSLTALLGISQGEASEDGDDLEGPSENANLPIATKAPESTHTPSSDISRTPEPSLENLVESPQDIIHQNPLDKPISPILITTAQSPTVSPPQPQTSTSSIIDPINSIEIDPTKLLSLSQLTKSIKTPSVLERKKPKKFTFLSPFQNNAWENQGHFKDLEDHEDANQSDDECSRSTHPSRIKFDLHVPSKTKNSKEDLDDIRDIELQDTQPLDDQATEKKDDGVNTCSYTIDLDELDKKAFKPEEEEKSKQSLIVKIRKPVIKPDNLKLLRVLESDNSHKDYINTKEFLTSMHSQSQNESRENQLRSNTNGNNMKSGGEGVLKNELLTKVRVFSSKSSLYLLLLIILHLT
ncbi:hypothetical protein BKA69DRAFT_364780 [Paraphysoderma sedebokerense]|nr:hypothetical protein BKA69DRAFT_364780 [Paraphysoderma sedebokerense]